MRTTETRRRGDTETRRGNDILFTVSPFRRLSVSPISNGGFTLLEVIVVIFLIILIAGLSSVFFANTLSSSKLSATVRELSATMRYARSLAQIRGEKQIVTIDLNARVYSMAGRGNRNIPPGIEIRVIDPLEGEIHREKYDIVLNESGGVEGGTIVLSEGKRSMSIRPDPIAGTVIVK